MVGVTLVEFLTARLDEDESLLRKRYLDVIEEHYGGGTMDDDPEWVQDMIDSFLDPLRPDTPPFYRRYNDGFGLEHAQETAAKYADHPDYRDVAAVRDVHRR